MKNQKGITLIALIITIVVLLILAVVTINAIQGDGIIKYPQNAKDDYTVQSNQEQTDSNTLLTQIETSQITWTYTDEDSSGNISIGDLVTASNNEGFYVIGGDTVGTAITSSTQKIILLAKNNLKADGSAQDPTGTVNKCTFSAAGGFTSGENLNNNSTVKADTTSAVYKAIQYGETLGVTTGRLMLKSEAEELKSVNANSDILYGRNGKSSGTFLNYWLGSAAAVNADHVWLVYGGSSFLSLDDCDDDDYCGVRPVVEILKSNIS